MSFNDWLAKGQLKPHKPSRQEIANLLAVADRSLRDARVIELSSDGRFQAAYTGALAAATAALHATGYRTSSNTPGHHSLTIASLSLTLCSDRDLVDRLNRFRRKRNRAAYDLAGSISEHEVKELLGLAETLRCTVEEWLRANHPSLLR